MIKRRASGTAPSRPVGSVRSSAFGLHLMIVIPFVPARSPISLEAILNCCCRRRRCCCRGCCCRRRCRPPNASDARRQWCWFKVERKPQRIIIIIINVITQIDTRSERGTMPLFGRAGLGARRRQLAARRAGFVSRSLSPDWAGARAAAPAGSANGAGRRTSAATPAPVAPAWLPAVWAGRLRPRSLASLSSSPPPQAGEARGRAPLELTQGIR
jgi:hypothetical protein